MKQMQYKKLASNDFGKKYEILAEGDFLDSHYLIVSFFSHPCAYIFYDEKHPLYKKDYSVINDEVEINVNGGLTYSRMGRSFKDGKSVLPDHWCLGWDYAHCDDFMMCPTLDIEGKKWTTAEILYQVKSAINDIAAWCSKNKKWGKL